MANKLILRPLTRIGGELEIKVSLGKNNRVISCSCCGNMFRGFENLLIGRSVIDCLVFVCRICGLCGTSHSIAASKAISKIFGLRAPPNGYLCKNVILGTEVLLSHLGHFYLCFAPDLAHPTYRALPFYKEIKKRFSPFSGISYRKFIQARKNLLVVLGLFAGKWPNTLSIHPGGTTKTINKSEIKRCLATLKEFQDFVEDVLLGCEIERWLEIKKVKEMEKWCNEKKEKQGDLALFVSFSKKANLHRLGKTPGKLLCFKGYEDQQGLWYKDGYYEKGVFHSLDTSKITEEKSFSWLEGEENHPFDDFTRPSPGKKGAYSWSKSPRYKGEAVEVGPLSRLVINREPLISDVFKDSGSNVYSRMLARLQEVVLLTRKINEWIKKINPEKPFYQKPKNVKNRKGEGIVEAPRGALGHWIQVEGDGKVRRYQIITPTTWNFSPKDSRGTSGPVEQSIVGTMIKDRENPIEIYHIIRSYDPCIFCSVHLINQSQRKK